MNNQSFVILRDLRGKPKALLRYERVEPQRHAVPPKSHHVVVVDRSGSMYGDMEQMRQLLTKLLAVEEFHRPASLLSLVSYSGNGDVTTHISRAAIADAPLAKLALRASGLTCMSGGLVAAHGLIEAHERTVVTVHSDGYANDPGVSQEQRACRAVVGHVHKLGATVNTVAHRDSSDFRFLAELANLGGGRCVRARDVRETYEAIHAGQAETLADSSRVHVALKGADALLQVNRAAAKVVLTSEPSITATIGDGDEFYRIYFPKMRQGSTYVLFPVEAQDAFILAAYARGLVGAGRATAAKEAALSSGYVALRQHLRALTGPEVADLASALENVLAHAHDANDVLVQREQPAEVPEPALTLPELLAVLARHPRGLRIHLPTLARSYRRRGLKRAVGKRLADGTVEAPAYRTVPSRAGTADEGWADLDAVEFNDSEATINLLLSQPVRLCGTVTRDTIPSVAGVSLENLREYRNYTVVGDGELCIDRLPCKVTSEKLRKDLAKVPVGWTEFVQIVDGGHVVIPSEGTGDPPLAKPIKLDLDLPLTRGEDAQPPAAERVRRMLKLAALQKLLSASLRGKSSDLAPEQVTALREHNVTPSLYYSPPTCSPYADLKKAQTDGLVDVRVSYRVTFGCDGVLYTGQLPSANEFLKRRFERRDGSKDAPTAEDVFAGLLTERPADAIKRLKIGPVDALVMPLYQAVVEKRAEPLHFVDDGQQIDGRAWADEEERKQILRRVERELEEERAKLRDLVFVVGASGAVPESWGPAIDATAVEKLGYSVGKAERDGQFYHVGGVLISVWSREMPYTVSDVPPIEAA